MTAEEYDDYYDDDGNYNFLWKIITEQTTSPNTTSSTTSKKKMKKPAAAKSTKKADTIHVYKDQDYIDTLSGPTKFAVIAISELVNQGKAEFLLLRDEEIKQFWDKHCSRINTIREKIAEEERIARVKADALAKLSDEEKKILGIK